MSPLSSPNRFRARRSVALPPAPGYFKRIREICDRYGVLLIADEVMCGSGRTGTFFALEQEGVAADIIVIAKGLGAGLQPIAATLASQKIVAAIEEGSGLLAHGQTYMSHPVACAAALAVLKAIDDENLLANVARAARNCEGFSTRASASIPTSATSGDAACFAASNSSAIARARRPSPPPPNSRRR